MQLLKCLFGVNLAALWYDEATRSKPDGQSKATPSGDRNDSSRWATSFYNQCGLADRRPAPSGLSRAARRQVNVITKFRAVSKLGPDRTALGSYIRLFEPMVVKALKVSEKSFFYALALCPIEFHACISVFQMILYQF